MRTRHVNIVATLAIHLVRGLLQLLWRFDPSVNFTKEKRARTHVVEEEGVAMVGNQQVAVGTRRGCQVILCLNDGPTGAKIKQSYRATS